MNQFTIESDVPVPEKLHRGKKPKYPFRQMEVGDSFAFPKTDRHRVYSAASYYGKRNGKKFRTACVEGDMARCWRIE